MLKLNRFAKIVSLALISTVIYKLAEYTFLLMASSRYIEPAENENSFLIHFLKTIQSFPAPSDITFFKAGIFPIYPILFHQISSLIPFDSLDAGRLLSIVCFLALAFVMVRYTLLKTKDPILSVSVPLLILGASPDFSYFFMNRVDAFFISVGLIGFIVLENVNGRSRNRFFLVTVAAVLCAVSTLSKQTAIIFLFVSLVSITLRSIKEKRLEEALLFISAFALTIIFYAKFGDQNLLFKYFMGLRMFASAFSPSWALEHLRHFAAYQFLLIILAGVATSQSLKKRIFLQSDLAAIFLIATASIKLWGNTSAFSNNFFLLNFGVAYFIVNRFPSIPENHKPKFTLAVVSSLTLSLFFPSSNYSLPEMSRRITNGGKAEVISHYLADNPGEYITSRADYLILDSGYNPIFEASVGMLLLKSLSLLEPKSPLLESALTKKDEISGKLSRKELQGVILGIQGHLLKEIFPEIDINYVPVVRENTNNGVFDIPMTLYIPKKSAK